MQRYMRKDRQRKQALVDAERAKPCADCGTSYPVRAMDLHHLDPSAKDGEITMLVRSAGEDRLRLELTKCITLCAVCHRLRH